MKYIKGFKMFESAQEEGFVVDKDTTVDQLEAALEETLEGSYSYGSESTFPDQVENIVYRSLLVAGKSEDEAEELSSELAKNFKSDSTSIPDEFDDYGRRTEGSNSYRWEKIFTFECGGDGYGFGGSIGDISKLLEDIKQLIEIGYIE